MLEQARQAKEAAEASRSMRSHSTIPLGSQGLMDHPRHQKHTAYQQEYKWHASAVGGGYTAVQCLHSSIDPERLQASGTCLFGFKICFQMNSTRCAATARGNRPWETVAPAWTNPSACCGAGGGGGGAWCLV
jgi:hypothetical protein